MLRSAHSSSIRTIGAALTVLLLMLSPWTHARADVRINGDDDTMRITVEATDSTVLEIAIALGQRFGFQVEATVANPSPIKISGRWNGTVSYILERILRDQNHVIIRTTSQSRIDRVVLSNSEANRRSRPAETAISGLRSESTDVHQPGQSKATETAPRSSSLEASKKLANRSPSTNPEANQVAIGRGIEIASAEAEQLAAMFSGNSSPATSAPIVEAHMMPAAISALTAQTISKAEGLAASLRVICGGSSCSGAVKR